jgi:hypothetical protein
MTPVGPIGCSHTPQVWIAVAPWTPGSQSSRSCWSAVVGAGRRCGNWGRRFAAKTAGLGADKLETIDEVCNYLENKSPYLAYDTALASG